MLVSLPVTPNADKMVEHVRGVTAEWCGRITRCSLMLRFYMFVPVQLLLVTNIYPQNGIDVIMIGKLIFVYRWKWTDKIQMRVIFYHYVCFDLLKSEKEENNINDTCCCAPQVHVWYSELSHWWWYTDRQHAHWWKSIKVFMELLHVLDLITPHKNVRLQHSLRYFRWKAQDLF